MAVLLDRAHLAANPQMRFLFYSIAALLITVISVVFLQYLAIGNVTPDLLLILCVWVGLSEGQFSGMLFAFCVGMIFDIASTNDVLGSNALAKVIAAFVAGYFYNEEKVKEILGGVRFLFIVAFSALMHNLVYHFLYIRPTEISFTEFFIKYGLAVTLYTTVLAIIPMLWQSKNMER